MVHLQIQPNISIVYISRSFRDYLLFSYELHSRFCINIKKPHQLGRKERTLVFQHLGPRLQKNTQLLRFLSLDHNFWETEHSPSTSRVRIRVVDSVCNLQGKWTRLELPCQMLVCNHTNSCM
jgi:hypothetical protein